MNGDGLLDIVSGEYTGKITLYTGTEKGFNTPVEIPQTTDISNNKIFTDFLFTNPTFADYNGDGLLDAFIGGAGGMRVMLNIGTKENPKFGDRTLLLGTDGIQISTKNLTDEEKKKALVAATDKKGTSADFKAYVYFMDWDGDGVGDIISTSSYCYSFEDAIDFHKGVQTDEGIRFEKKVPLFTASDNTKALPGSILIPYFYDINNDGALDLLFGVSLNCEIKNNYKINETINNLYAYEKNDFDEFFKLKTRGFVIVMLSNKKYK